MSPSAVQPLRIGMLGAARIAPMALVRPARRVPGVEVAAVAARHPERARRFAARHGIPRVHDSYDALVEDPALDAVYVPLPNGLHATWTLRALAAGKHVLCEKPFTSNAAEAETLARAAAASDRVVMEAFHWRYHPLAERMVARARDGLGPIRRVETAMCIPLPIPGDIRYRLDLAGGATGRITCSLLSRRLLAIGARVVGERGELRVFNPVLPQLYHHLRLRTPAGTRTERFTREPTYAFQLRAFQLRAFHCAATEGVPVPTGPDDAVANMRTIDAVYTAAGLSPRSGAGPPADG